MNVIILAPREQFAASLCRKPEFHGTRRTIDCANSRVRYRSRRLTPVIHFERPHFTLDAWADVSMPALPCQRSSMWHFSCASAEDWWNFLPSNLTYGLEALMLAGCKLAFFFFFYIWWVKTLSQSTCLGYCIAIYIYVNENFMIFYLKFVLIKQHYFFCSP